MPQQYPFPNIFQVDRGQAPPPGSYDPSQAQPDPNQKIRYIRVPSGSGGFIYWQADSPQGQALQAQQAGELVEVPAARGFTNPQVTDGSEGMPGAPVSPPQPTNAPPAQYVEPAPAPVAPAPQPVVPASAAPAAVPTSPPGNPTPVVNNATGAPPNVTAGTWVRISPPGDETSGDVIGVNIVPIDSPPAKAALANPATAANVRVIDTSFQYQGRRDIIDPKLMTSENFQALARLNGSNIIAYNETQLPPNDASNPGAMQYTVKWRLADGAEQAYTLTSTQRGSQPYFRITGAPEIDTTNVSGPNKEALTRAQAEYQAAQANLARAQASQIPGQVESTDLKNAKERSDQAERAWNTANGLGNVTHSDAIKDSLTRSQVVQTQVNTENTAAQTAATIQGTQNQTYQNVLQYYRDLGNDEQTAQRLTMEYFTNKATVDNNNNGLALNAGKAEVDANTAANTQRVSLANNRLSQASQGFSEDARAANDINQYLKPGSSKGGDAFMALQAMRYANAQKYGAFDVNDRDLRYDETKLPNGIRAYANPSNPSFATYPSYDDLRNEAFNTGERWGIHGRPAPPDHTNVVQPRAIPSANNVPAPPGQPRPGTTASATAPRPAPAAQPAGIDRSVYKLDNMITAQDDHGNTVYVTRAQWESEDPAHPSYISTLKPINEQSKADFDRGRGPAPTPTTAVVGNERPDDILTIHDTKDNKTVQIARADWDAQRAAYPYMSNPEIQVINAESGSAYNRLDDGTYIRRPVAQTVPPPTVPSTPNISSLRFVSDETDQGGGITYAGPDDRVWVYSQGQFQDYGTRPGMYERGKPITIPAAASPDGKPAAAQSVAVDESHPGGSVLPYPSQPQTATSGNVSYVVPTAVNDLTSPSLAYTNQVLGDPDEELKRRQQQALGRQFGSPQAIYGLFDGSYDQFPTFF